MDRLYEMAFQSRTEPLFSAPSIMLISIAARLMEEGGVPFWLILGFSTKSSAFGRPCIIHQTCNYCGSQRWLSTIDCGGRESARIVHGEMNFRVTRASFVRELLRSAFRFSVRGLSGRRERGGGGTGKKKRETEKNQVDDIRINNTWYARYLRTATPFALPRLLHVRYIRAWHGWPLFLSLFFFSDIGIVRCRIVTRRPRPLHSSWTPPLRNFEEPYARSTWPRLLFFQRMEYESRTSENDLFPFFHVFHERGRWSEPNRYRIFKRRNEKKKVGLKVEGGIPWSCARKY